jgi:hypothetical protein
MKKANREVGFFLTADGPSAGRLDRGGAAVNAGSAVPGAIFGILRFRSMRLL